jgi:cytochrome c oxidase subunit 4
MGHLSYEESKKLVFRGMWLLAIVTLVEVAVSLFGKGHIISGVENSSVIFFITGLIIIALSVYKAYFIIYEFMHMKYEVKGLAMSVLLPTVLLIWAIIAFFQEGNAWKSRRQQVQEQNKEQVIDDNAKMQEGSLPADTKRIEKF